MIDQKLIVFHSSPDFSDNPRALYDYVVENSNLEPFWVISDARMCETLSAQGVPCGLVGAEETLEKIAAAHYLVSASFEFAYGKKLGQIHVSAWHGFGPKVVGFFDEATQSADSFKSLDVITTQSDIIAITSRSSQIITSGMFATDPRKALVTGFARNDYLFSEDGRSHLATLFGEDLVDSGASFIFYLPTMRKGLKAEGAQFEDNIFNYSDYDVEALDAFLEAHNAYIVGKLHFADNELVGVDRGLLPRRMLLLSNEDLIERQLTIYHLLNAFDALITDYSSVYTDYLLLDRPIVFSCPDYEEYSRDRGFIADDPRFMMPGSFVETQEGLLDALTSIARGVDPYKGQRSLMMPYFHTYADGNSSRRLFDAMLEASETHVLDCHKDYASLYVSQSSPLLQYVISSPFTGELFFDCGSGYSEENKATCTYALVDVDSDGFVDIEFELPQGAFRALRFDPDNSDRVIIEKIVLRVGGRAFEPSWTNGFEVDGKTVFVGDDPQVHFNNLDVACNGVACIRLKALDLLSDGTRLLAETASDSCGSRHGLRERVRSKVFGKKGE